MYYHYHDRALAFGMSCDQLVVMESQETEGTSAPPSTSMEETSPTPRPFVIGRPRQSPVWQHCVYDAVKGKSGCQVPVHPDGVNVQFCGAEISGKFPTNLKAHIKATHSATFSEVRPR